MISNISQQLITTLPTTTMISGNMTNTTIGSIPSGGSLMLGLLVSAVALLIFLGNLMILIVLKLYKPLTIPDVLVVSLALSDFLNVSFPVQILNFTMNIVKKPYTEELCIFFVWSTYTLRMASVMTVSVICLDRWIAILKPLYYRSKITPEVSKIKAFITALWVIAAVIALPPHIGLGSNGYKKGRCLYQLLNLGLGYGILIVILGLSQLGLVLYCYITIKISTTSFLQRQSQMRIPDETSHQDANSTPKLTKKDALKKGRVTLVSQDSHTSRTSLSSTLSHLVVGGHRKRTMTDGEKQVTTIEKMMAAVVVLYYISWLPFLITNLFSLITGKSNPLVVTVVGFFSLINGLINPIVYGTLNMRYRKGYAFVFRKILSLCGGRQPAMTLADFDESRRRLKKNLENVQKMRSISVYENSSTRSRGYTWSTSSTRSSLSSDLDHDNLQIRDSLNFNNNNSIRSRVFQIPIVEEPEADTVFATRDDKSLEIDLDASFAESTMTENTQVDLDYRSEGNGHKKVSNRQKSAISMPSTPTSPPVIRSYRLSSSLDNLPVSLHCFNDMKQNGDIKQNGLIRNKCDDVEESGDGNGITNNQSDNEESAEDNGILFGTYDNKEEIIDKKGIETEELNGKEGSEGKNGITQKQERNEECQDERNQTHQNNVVIRKDSKLGDVIILQETDQDAVILVKNDEPLVNFRIKSSSYPTEPIQSKEASVSVRRSATMASKEVSKRKLRRTDDLESMLDTCIRRKDELTNPRKRQLCRDLSLPDGYTTSYSLNNESNGRETMVNDDKVKKSLGEVNLAFSIEEQTDL